MIGYMHYNRFGSDGFTDRGKGRTSTSVQTCPVCLCKVNAQGGTLPDGTLLSPQDWTVQVCKTVKDDTVCGGYQPGCLAGTYPAS